MAAERNWARNLTYSAPIAHPASLEEACELVGRSARVHALGTRHSFSDCADGDGVLVALDRLPMDLEIDEQAATATVGAAVRMGDLGQALDARGWALANLASLPHISVGGAVATGTHGSGDRLGTMSSAVRALQIIGPDGALREVTGDEVAGSVVAMGALGIVTRLTLAIEPTYEIRQDAYLDLPWSAALDRFDEITAVGYSVSLFTRWRGPVERVLVKSRDTEPPDDLFGARPAGGRIGVAEIGVDTKNTEAGGVPGPWWDRLPHFRMAATPSVGEELQSEYLVPRATAKQALATVHEMADDLDAALHISEIRTMAADDLWLSGAYGTDAVSIQFTWRDLPDLVLPLLPRVEERLLPLGARPHWAKLFAASGVRLRDHYPRWNDFERLRDLRDPDRTFGNAFLEGVFGA
ncbi:FAD-binding protein [Amnibacterium sp.]|uniref:FAD-binding protein n=1 Tax=Amnibacterium sp. TaxID=1872496 RepID=UPI00262DC0E5|nr:FAD-binding protein [Amnibacterium sp.]MCU1472058.1 FAD-binding protein [Amnibacterium sp.]